MLTTASFRAMGVENTVAVDDPEALPAALALAEQLVGEIDRVCSRFRDDSELCDLNRRAGSGDVPISAVLEGAVVAAMQTAEMTSGLVDLTVGRCVEAIGYDVSFGALPADIPGTSIEVHRAPGWRALGYDEQLHTLRIPAGAAIDLGASGKAWAADMAAALVARTLGVGVLVECGGDLAACGVAPAGGWPVRVASDVGAADGQDIVVFDGGVATSGKSRRWRRGDVDLHDIIDPSTGLPAITPWAMVTVAAASCVEANAAATAALIMGEGAADWLAELNLPSRLVRADGGVVHAGGWAA